MQQRAGRRGVAAVGGRGRLKPRGRTAVGIKAEASRLARLRRRAGERSATTRTESARAANLPQPRLGKPTRLPRQEACGKSKAQRRKALAARTRLVGAFSAFIAGGPKKGGPKAEPTAQPPAGARRSRSAAGFIDNQERKRMRRDDRVDAFLGDLPEWAVDHAAGGPDAIEQVPCPEERRAIVRKNLQARGGPGQDRPGLSLPSCRLTRVSPRESSSIRL